MNINELKGFYKGKPCRMYVVTTEGALIFDDKSNEILAYMLDVSGQKPIVLSIDDKERAISEFKRLTDQVKSTDKYTIGCSTFKGKNDFGYTYELSFNKSLVCTSKFTAIEYGLNLYSKWEQATGIKKWILSKLTNFK